MTIVYTIKTDGIYSENFEGESVIVNLHLGNYYGLQGMGSFLWGLFSKPVSSQEILEALQAKYPGQQEEIKAEVAEFVEALIQHGLIDQTSQPAQKPDLSAAPAVYSSPKLETYEDLQELFLLDPVHMIDNQMGWPVEKKSELSEEHAG